MAGRDWSEVVKAIQRGFVAAAFAALLLPTDSAASAETETNDGNGLYELCSGTEAIYTLGICHGYISGVRDALRGVVICPPSNVTNGQVFDIVINGLRDHPEERQKESVVLIIKYLSAAFPCQRSR